MKNKKICVLGGDSRQVYLAHEFARDGFFVKTYANSMQKQPSLSLEEALYEVDIVILPYPLSPDGICLNCPMSDSVYLDDIFKLLEENKPEKIFGGGVSEKISTFLSNRNLKIIDYGKNEAMQIKNALCTAEGAIEIAIKELPITLRDAKITVLGYGRIGRILSKMLCAFGTKVYGVARKNSDFANMYIDGVEAIAYSQISHALRNSDLIFNTVPALVLDKGRLKYIDKETKIVDLASAPGGVDHYAADEFGIEVICALSLPGKVSPKTAAMIIKETIIDVLESYEE